eukprot:6180808-Pleurochrysis_carterae.AAC.3
MGCANSEVTRANLARASSVLRAEGAGKGLVRSWISSVDRTRQLAKQRAHVKRRVSSRQLNKHMGRKPQIKYCVGLCVREGSRPRRMLPPSDIGSLACDLVISPGVMSNTALHCNRDDDEVAGFSSCTTERVRGCGGET